MEEEETGVKRKLAAILAADVVGYSQLMGEDEQGTLDRLHERRQIIDRLIDDHHGRFVGSAGDSVLAEFASSVDAVNCAWEIQKALSALNLSVPESKRMELRIGVNLGDVLVEGPQIYGDGVNVAARLEGLADSGDIAVSGSIYEQVHNKLDHVFDDMGMHSVKNIAEPVQCVPGSLERGGRTAQMAQEASIAPGWLAMGGIGSGWCAAGADGILRALDRLHRNPRIRRRDSVTGCAAAARRLATWFNV